MRIRFDYHSLAKFGRRVRFYAGGFARYYMPSCLFRAFYRRRLRKLTPEQREAYKTIGGVPFLDNEYTVYGEVVEGLDVVDAIQNVKTNRQDRPLENVVIESVEII